MVTVAAVLLMLCVPTDRAAARRPAPVAGALGRPVRASAAEAAPGRAPGIGAVAEAASGRGAGSRARKPAAEKQAPAEADKPAEQAAPRRPAAALGLPAGADGRDRHRPQHSRHPRPRRLRRRGSGAAGGGGAAGQAAGCGEARGDPALPDGVGDRGLDPHRHGAAGGEASAASSATSTISTRSNAAAATASPARRLSEHGRANALDVRAFKLANGQSISLTDRTVSRELRESVLHSMCARFTTVLGPGSDGYHEDHIHLDLMERRNNYKICQWDVWDPLPQIAPLLPAERPDEAPPREVAAKSDAAKAGCRPSPRAAKRSRQIRYGRAGRRRHQPPTKKRRQNRRF